MKTLTALFAAITLAGAGAGGASAQTQPSAQGVDVKGVAEAPLVDLNVVRADIPKVLLDAEQDVYLPPKPHSCAAIARSVATLDEALGEDFDVASRDASPTRRQKTTAQANAALKDTASGVIPFRGWVRQMSGAAQHADAVQRAIAAGRVRRGYLKGLGQSMRCPPPAAPLVQARASIPL